MGHFWAISAILGNFWAIFAILGHFGPIWEILGNFWAIFWCYFFVAKYASVLFKSFFATLLKNNMPNIDIVIGRQSKNDELEKIFISLFFLLLKVLLDYSFWSHTGFRASLRFNRSPD